MVNLSLIVALFYIYTAAKAAWTEFEWWHNSVSSTDLTIRERNHLAKSWCKIERGEPWNFQGEKTRLKLKTINFKSSPQKINYVTIWYKPIKGVILNTCFPQIFACSISRHVKTYHIISPFILQRKVKSEHQLQRTDSKRWCRKI